jgi:hypothetical protein
MGNRVVRSNELIKNKRWWGMNTKSGEEDDEHTQHNSIHTIPIKSLEERHEVESPRKRFVWNRWNHYNDRKKSYHDILYVHNVYPFYHYIDHFLKWYSVIILWSTFHNHMTHFFCKKRCSITMVLLPSTNICLWFVKFGLHVLIMCFVQQCYCGDPHHCIL